MFGRKSLGSLFVLAVLAPAVCMAQPGSGYGPPSGSPRPMMLPSSGQYPPQYVGTPTQNGGNSRTIFEELPDDRGWLFDDSPLNKSLESSFRHAFFRTEYLLWGFGKPGRIQLSAPRLVSPTDPIATGESTDAFTATNPTTGQTGTATAPNLDSFDLGANNGFRGTFGMPFGPGAFEASAFIFQTSNDTHDFTNLIIPAEVGPPAVEATFIAQPVLISGALSTDSLVYTESYQVSLKTAVWGTEANYVFAPPNVGTGDFFTISPIVGFRYFNFRETLNQSGVYQFSTNGGVTTTDVRRRIDASNGNNSYGPQIGLRTEVNIARLTIGAEPKIMLGLNSYTANLQTANILNPTETPLNIRGDGTNFGPLADIKVYSRFALTQNLGVFIAYNALWAGQLTRPYDNIVYNTAAGGAVNDFQQKVNTTDAVLQGMSFGAEYRY